MRLGDWLLPHNKGGAEHGCPGTYVRLYDDISDRWCSRLVAGCKGQPCHPTVSDGTGVSFGLFTSGANWQN